MAKKVGGAVGEPGDREARVRAQVPLVWPKKTLPRLYAEALVQCWECGAVRTVARVWDCPECHGAIEVLEVTDGGGRRYH